MPSLLCLLLLATCVVTGAFFVEAARPIACLRAPSAAARTGPCALREIAPIGSEEAYDELIESAKAANSIVVIKFYAGWCRACKAMAPKFARMADDFPDVEFHEILFEENKKLCKKLGIRVLPFMEIVDGSRGKIDSFTCGPSKIGMLVDKVEGTIAAHDNGVALHQD